MPISLWPLYFIPLSTQNESHCGKCTVEPPWAGIPGMTIPVNETVAPTWMHSLPGMPPGTKSAVADATAGHRFTADL